MPNGARLLDCTIRDGGFVNNWNFSEVDVVDRLCAADAAGVSYFEIGYLRTRPASDDEHQWVSLDCEVVQRVVSAASKRRQAEGLKGKLCCKIAAMVDCWRYDHSLLPTSLLSGIHLLRVCTLMEHMQSKAVPLINRATDFGYETSLNVLRISHRQNDAEAIKKTIQELPLLTMVAFPDSFGGMRPKHLREFLRQFCIKDRKYLVCFHAHDNGGIAMANALTALEEGVDVLDGTILGVGRGGGNLQLETIVLHLVVHEDSTLDPVPLLKLIDSRTVSLHQPTVNAMAGVLAAHPTLVSKLIQGDKSFEIERSGDTLSRLSSLWLTLLAIPFHEREFY